MNQYNLKHPSDKGAPELTSEEKLRQKSKLLLPCNLPPVKYNNIQVQQKIHENTNNTEIMDGINDTKYDERLPDTNAEEPDVNCLPPPQHNTLHPSAILTTNEDTPLNLSANDSNDWDLRQLEAYQDIVA